MRWRGVVLGSVVSVVGSMVACSLGGCDSATTTTPTSAASPSARSASASPSGDGATPQGGASDPAASSAASGSSSAPGTAAATGSAVTDADRSAGVLTMDVPDIGDGKLVTVAGTAPAPDPSKRVVQVAVQVEGGQQVDQAKFADFVLATLNDPRSWAHDNRSFERVASTAEADVNVVLASPRTSASLCRPLITGGRLSCRAGKRAILTNYRWVNGQDDYGTDRNQYRHYVVNHEVGHFFGHGHLQCPGAGKQAPVMMQQTKGLKGCTPNPWPYP